MEGVNDTRPPLEKLLASALAVSLLSFAGCSKTDEVTTDPSQEQSEVISASPGSDAKSDAGTSVVGRATWYGPGLYGNKTASGEVLKKNTLTAAHSQLPIGTKVKVTRQDTDESVIVVINDRKPFKEGTVIDLAHGAANELDIDDDGEAIVSIEVID